MPTEKPLPCPFCGGYGRLEIEPRPSDTVDPFTFFVRCDSCAAQGPWFKTEGNAIRRWNTRAGSTR